MLVDVFPKYSPLILWTVLVRRVFRQLFTSSTGFSLTTFAGIFAVLEFSYPFAHRAFIHAGHFCNERDTAATNLPHYQFPLDLSPDFAEQ
ncbi:MAG TPA: hypothetical protein DEB39_11140 [Planctomycetaceae bacterium]|nr:hypothetical protein [Planctomycetaceae bacterium]